LSGVEKFKGKRDSFVFNLANMSTKVSAVRVLLSLAVLSGK